MGDGSKCAKGEKTGDRLYSLDFLMKIQLRKASSSALSADDAPVFSPFAHSEPVSPRFTNRQNMRYPVVHGVPALPDFGKCENEILEIDNGRFYGYNKAILVAEYMKKVRWIFLSE